MPLKKTTIYENLKYIDEGKTQKDRIARLYERSSVELKQLFDVTFNPNIKWALPESKWNFKVSKDEPASLYLNLLKEIKKMPIFLSTGPYAKLDPIKRKRIFISMLENVHPDDAKVLLAMKDKTLPFKNINAELLLEAYPPSKKNFTSTWKTS